MICLTGDVHQEYDSEEQSYYDGSEFEAALEYVEIARSYDIDLTLFLTGKVAKENSEQVRGLDQDDGVEIGGHTWSAFRPSWLHRQVFHRVMGSVYGPRRYQKRDIERTLRLLERQTDKRIRSWRTHSYESNHHTYDILSDTSIVSISDEKSPDAVSPFEYENYDLVEYPINVLPDHEHLIHGGRTKRSVQVLREQGWTDEFGSDSYPIEEWGRRIRTQVDKIQQADGTATLLIHPGCMKAADDLDTFEQICAHIASAGYETETMRDTR